MSAARDAETAESLEAAFNASEVVPEESDVDLLAFLPLVKSIAVRIHARIPSYAAVDLNDLMQAGLLGLVHAGKGYCKSRRVPFPVYARFRIRGEMIDFLRQSDFASRGLRRLDKRVKAIRAELTASMLREPSEAEVAASLAADPAAREKSTQYLRLPPITMTSLEQDEADAAFCQTREPSPDSCHSTEEARHILEQAIERLPPRCRELIRLYYQCELTMREIGEQFQVNESRVSQLHRRALDRLARSLRAVGIQSTRHI